MIYVHASNLFSILVDHISSNRRTGCISHNEDCFIVNEVFMYYLHASNLFSILVDHISSSRRTGCISHGQRYTIRIVLLLMRLSCIIYMHLIFTASWSITSLATDGQDVFLMDKGIQ